MVILPLRKLGFAILPSRKWDSPVCHSQTIHTCKYALWRICCQINFFYHGKLAYPFCPSLMHHGGLLFIHGRLTVVPHGIQTTPPGQVRKRGNGSPPPPAPPPPTPPSTVDCRAPPGFPRSQPGVPALPADAGAAPSAGWRRTCQILSKGTYCCCGGNLTVPNRLDETRLV